MTRLALARQTEQDGGSRGVGPRDARQAPVPSSHALRGGGKHAASEQKVTAQALGVSSGGSTRTRERRHATPPAVHAAKHRWQYWSGGRRRRGSPAPRARRYWATVSPAAQPGEKNLTPRGPPRTATSDPTG